MTKSPRCIAPLGDETLLAHWLDELGAEASAHVDEHVLGCAECSERLAQIVALADGTREAFERGQVRVFVTDAFARHTAARKTRVREYRVAHNGSVNCSVAPDDELVVSRLEAPLGGVRRLDVIAYLDDQQTDVFHDVPFDAAAGEVELTPKVELLKLAPTHRRRFRLVAVDESGERVIGDYTFHHSAHVAG